MKEWKKTLTLVKEKKEGEKASYKIRKQRQ